MIDFLLYLIASRANIMFVTCLCARFQTNPKEAHLSACKRIFTYLSGTINLALCYLSCMSFNLIAYSDTDNAGYKIDRKKHFRYMSFFRRIFDLMGT